MTSSPEPMPSASSTRTRASVPLATPTVSGTSRYAAASRSNAATFWPRMNSPLASTPSITSRMRGRSGSYCALTSTSGSGRTVSKSRRPNSAHYEIQEESQDSGHNGVVREAEVVVEGLVAPAQAPACACEREAPGRGADEGEDRVAPEGHPEDPGRDRDEGANDGRYPPEQDREVLPALEPALGALEALTAEMEPAAPSFEERPAAIETDCPAADRADEVAERPCQRHRDIRPDARGDAGPEEIDELRRERPGGQRPGVDHDELARSRERGVDRNQQKDGVEAVVSDQRGQEARDAGDRHAAQPSYSRNGAVSSTAPRSFVAVTLSTYRPGRPVHEAVPSPAGRLLAGSARTRAPPGVSIRTTTRAERASLKPAATRLPLARAVRNPSVLLNENCRSAVERRPRSSSATTRKVHAPSGWPAPSQLKR